MDKRDITILKHMLKYCNEIPVIKAFILKELEK